MHYPRKEPPCPEWTRVQNGRSLREYPSAAGLHGILKRTHGTEDTPGPGLEDQAGDYADAYGCKVYRPEHAPYLGESPVRAGEKADDAEHHQAAKRPSHSLGCKEGGQGMPSGQFSQPGRQCPAVGADPGAEAAAAVRIRRQGDHHEADDEETEFRDEIAAEGDCRHTEYGKISPGTIVESACL